MIKSYKGKLADGAIATIPLHTNNGKTGYKITKMQLMHCEPGEQHAEHTIKVYSIPQSTADNAIDFTNVTLLGAGYLTDNADPAYPVSTIIVFDNVTFNQDIFVTHVDTGGAQPCNYYLELEQVNLTEDQALVAIVKNLRNEQ